MDTEQAKVSFKDAIDENLTLENVSCALRMCEIILMNDTIDKIIDVIELVGYKGKSVTISDINYLKREWEKSPRTR